MAGGWCALNTKRIEGRGDAVSPAKLMKISNTVLQVIEPVGYYDGPFVGTARGWQGEWWFQLLYSDWHLRYRAVGFYAPPILSLADFAQIEAEQTISPTADAKRWSDEFFALTGQKLARSPYRRSYAQACSVYGDRTMGLHMTVEELFASGEVQLQMATIDRITVEDSGFRVLIPESVAEMNKLHDPAAWHPGGEELLRLDGSDYPSNLFDDSKLTDMRAPYLYEGPV